MSVATFSKPVNFTNSTKHMSNVAYIIYTIEPFGVVLSCAEWRHVPQAAVDHGVTTRKINDCGSIEVTTFCYHGSGIVFGVIRTAGNPVHRLNHMGEIRGKAGSTDGRECISPTGEETRTGQEEDTHVVLTLVLREKEREKEWRFFNFSVLSHPTFIL